MLEAIVAAVMASLLCAALCGVTSLAYKKPEEYRRVYLVIVALGIVALTAHAMLVAPDLATQGKTATAYYGWLESLVWTVEAYLLFLLVLPHIVGVDLSTQTESRTQ